MSMSSAGDAEAVAELGGAGSADRIERNQEIADQQQQQRAQHGQVAPIPARQNLARRHGKENREKGKVETADASTPSLAEHETPTRPVIHNRTRPASGPLCNAMRPVQFGIAVGKNPATTAAP
jgi:hypothetical protein